MGNVNMYSGVKARIKANDSFSDSFPFKKGVRQGENLSPFLFSMFLNDLEEFMISNGDIGLNSLSSKFEKDFSMSMHQNW
jgi:hypothetical protein